MGDVVGRKDGNGRKNREGRKDVSSEMQSYFLHRTVLH